MSTRSELDKAISKHALWKMRLRVAIDTGRSEWQPDSVGCNDLCDFGKWLQIVPDEEKSSVDFKKVHQLHAEFHAVAAVVLNLALHDQREQANIALASTFKEASAKLTNAMVEWKSRLA